MKKMTFIALFIGAHVIFIFLQIHKHSQFVKQSYRAQKYKRQKNLLLQQQQKLTQQLYALQDRAAVKKFAQQELNMHPIKMEQIKRLPHE